MAARTGPLATTSCEPRQARKGAAAAVASGAGVWLIGAATPSQDAQSGRVVHQATIFSRQ